MSCVLWTTASQRAVVERHRARGRGVRQSRARWSLGGSWPRLAIVRSMSFLGCRGAPASCACSALLSPEFNSAAARSSALDFRGNAGDIPVGDRSLDVVKDARRASAGAFESHAADAAALLKCGLEFPFNPVAPRGAAANHADNDVHSCNPVTKNLLDIPRTLSGSARRRCQVRGAD